MESRCSQPCKDLRQPKSKNHKAESHRALPARRIRRRGSAKRGGEKPFHKFQSTIPISKGNWSSGRRISWEKRRNFWANHCRAPKRSQRQSRSADRSGEGPTTWLQSQERGNIPPDPGRTCREKEMSNDSEEVEDFEKQQRRIEKIQ